LSDEEFKPFEKMALAFLRTLGFTPVGYYPYSHASDISGYLEPKPPFKVPVKAMVEIVRKLPTPASIEGFHKLVKGSLVERSILICQKPFTELSPDAQSLVERLSIEFFDQVTISAELERKRISDSQVQSFSKIYELVGAAALSNALPEIALQRIPDTMREDVDRLRLKPWQVFEQTVYSIFHYCFNLTVKKFGEDCLFENEPEGVAIVGDIGSFAFIYECKSAAQSYTMTSDHELRYIGYIREKRQKVNVVERAELKYFVIIAPDFSGDIKERREKIFKETQVLVVFLPAEILRIFSEWASELPSNLKRLVDFRDVYTLNEVVVSKESLKSYFKKFEDENRSRW
jgi:hypothetical protein